MKTCPKCKEKMEKGTYSGSPVAWQSSSEQSFLRSSGKEISTYACEKCGYLESYVQVE